LVKEMLRAIPRFINTVALFVLVGCTRGVSVSCWATVASGGHPSIVVRTEDSERTDRKKVIIDASGVESGATEAVMIRFGVSAQRGSHRASAYSDVAFKVSRSPLTLTPELGAPAGGEGPSFRRELGGEVTVFYPIDNGDLRSWGKFTVIVLDKK
jgi:hypothetical protein